MSEKTATQVLRGRPVTHDEAAASADRLINSRFGKSNGARASIPARPDDDDIVIVDYILEQRASDPINSQGAVPVEREPNNRCQYMLGETQCNLRFAHLGPHSITLAPSTAPAAPPPGQAEPESKVLLDSFIDYCHEHPGERFWQALRNWSEWPFHGVSLDREHWIDTFYWEGRNEKERE